ncbi:hypothetical protein [Dysgonomonas sp.]
MKYKLLFILSVVLVSCNKRQDMYRDDVSSSNIDTLQVNKIDSLLSWNINSVPSSLEGYTPAMVVGDWDGTGRRDTLYECYYSRVLKREIVSPLFLYRDKISYDSLVDIASNLDPVIYIVNKNQSMDTITIDARGQLFGMYFLDNKGDLDGDGKDELLYMTNFADWSSVNTYNICSRKNGKWINLYNFAVWEWQFEEGDKNVIKKLPDYKIKITFCNEEAMEDTKIVDLSKIKYTN